MRGRHRSFFFFKQKTAYEMEPGLEFRRVLFRSLGLQVEVQHSLLVRVLEPERHLADDGERLRGLELPRQERSEEHTSELQSRLHLVCRLLLEKKKKTTRGQNCASSIVRRLYRVT